MGSDAAHHAHGAHEEMASRFKQLPVGPPPESFLEYRVVDDGSRPVDLGCPAFDADGE